MNVDCYGHFAGAMLASLKAQDAGTVKGSARRVWTVKGSSIRITQIGTRGEKGCHRFAWTENQDAIRMMEAAQIIAKRAALSSDAKASAIVRGARTFASAVTNERRAARRAAQELDTSVFDTSGWTDEDTQDADAAAQDAQDADEDAQDA